MSTTPKPYTLADFDSPTPDRFLGEMADDRRVLATVEALDAAQARVKELEREVMFAQLNDSQRDRLAAAELRVKELEALMLDGTKMALRNGVLQARAEKAEAEASKLRMEFGVSKALERCRLHDGATLYINTSGQQRRVSCAECLDAQLTESRASEARMREALEELADIVQGVLDDNTRRWPDHLDSFTLQPARAALSTPVSDWLAARDRRVAEAQREACREAARETDRDAEMLIAAVGAAPLVEFKPEGA
jgi:hypothetical protein